jgi:hypothetical protein
MEDGDERLSSFDVVVVGYLQSRARGRDSGERLAMMMVVVVDSLSAMHKKEGSGWKQLSLLVVVAVASGNVGREEGECWRERGREGEREGDEVQHQRTSTTRVVDSFEHVT